MANLPTLLQRSTVAAMMIGGLLLSGCTTTSGDSAGSSTAKATATPPAAADEKKRTGEALSKSKQEDSKGEQCREFQRTITIGGKTETAYGTACRQPDGTWKQEDELSPAPRRQATAPRDRSFPYRGYPQRNFGPGYAPYYFGLGFGGHGGSIGYGVGF